MRICFLIADISGKGGTERVTTDIANGLLNKGKEVSIITCKGFGGNRYGLDTNIKIYCLHGEKSKGYVLRKLCNSIKIWNIIRKNKFDVVIAVDIYLYLYLLLVQITGICRCIAWEHFNYYISDTKYSLIARNIAVKLADRIVVLGKKDLENYRKHYRNANNIVYIYNPVAFQKTEYIGADTYRIIAAGRLCKQKGFDLLIKAWKKVEMNEKIDGKWKLDIFGDGEEEKYLNELIEKNRLKRIFLKGYTDDLEKEITESSIFVLSSRYEGFVLVLLEAQAKGLPCISFNCKEGPSEIIRDGVNGFLVEEENAEILADKMMILMNNRELRINFAENAQRDLQRFELETILDSWEKLLNEITSERD